MTRLSAWKGSSVSQQFHLSAQFTVAALFTLHSRQGSPGGTSSLHRPRRHTTRFWQSRPVAVEGVGPSSTRSRSVQGPVAPVRVACPQVVKLAWTDAWTAPLAGAPQTWAAPFTVKSFTA